MKCNTPAGKQSWHELYQKDIASIIARQHDQSGDYWGTKDKRIYRGSPFSTLECMLMLSELEAAPCDILAGACEFVLSLWKQDGRFQIAPKTAIYPCHTASVARVLCRLGYAKDERLLKTFEHLMEIQHEDGGWRCNTYKFGRGEETAFSNPGTTLVALDAFRFTEMLNNDPRLDKAVESLLNHWLTRIPIGPCHYGIGKLFMKVEYPFFRYNIFFYVYVLSFYNKAKNDPRFLDALNVLKSKTVQGKIIVENPNAKLADFEFCKKGEVSELATMRYNEILSRIG